MNTDRGEGVASAALFPDHARRYSQLGWALTRLDGKKGRNGWNWAKPVEPEAAAGQWSQWGGRWNLGVLLGASGLIVVEYDTDAGKAKLDELVGELPTTPIVLTGSGKLHLYFRDPGGIKKGARGGLELRVGSHLCVLPPSVHPGTGKPYTWLLAPWEHELGDVPAQVLDFFAGSTNGQVQAEPVGEIFEEGTRHQNLLSIAGMLRRRGLDEREILATLTAVDAERCQPSVGQERLRALACDVAGRYQPDPKATLVAPAAAEPGDAEVADEKKSPTGGKDSTATQIVNLALDAGVDLFHSPRDEPYVAFDAGGHRETWPTGSRSFRRFLARLFYETVKAAPPAEAVKNALLTLEAISTFDGDERPVALRVGGGDDVVYLDLCDEDWNAVEITANGWRVVADPPVHFRRAPGMRPLPLPVPGGSLADLDAHLNTGSDRDTILIIGSIVQALRPAGPFTVLGLFGEQGSAKSTTARIWRELLDPGQPPTNSLPRSSRDLAIAANNSFCLAIDNVSKLQAWLSDDLCRLATGGGFRTRTLFQDADETLFDSTRPIALNGIGEVATRPDLLDRCILVELPAIPEDERRDEDSFWTEFDEAKPMLLGGLLDAVARALRDWPTTRLDRVPRMADTARWLTAAEPALGWEPGTFVKAYGGNRAELNELALESSLLAGPLLELLDKNDGDWTGGHKALLTELNAFVPDSLRKADGWPRTPQGISGELRRIAPNLRASGIDVSFPDRTRLKRTLRLVRL
jgi:hypothetical protein